MPKKTTHPSPYSEAVLRYVANGTLLTPGRWLDPMAGIGRIHWLANAQVETVGVEIEPEWAHYHRDTIVGNALALPFDDESFDGVLVSPVYGNRFSDSHRASDGSHRRSYTHDLRSVTGDPDRRLHPDNSGTLYAWQPAYWQFHHKAWREVHRVLRPGGRFLLNISDCIHDHKRIDVVDTHRAICESIGFGVDDIHEVKTPRMRYGENHKVRVEVEQLVDFRKRRS